MRPQKALNAGFFALASPSVSYTLDIRRQGASSTLTEAHTVACGEFDASILYTAQTVVDAYQKISILGLSLSFLTQTKACSHHCDHIQTLFDEKIGTLSKSRIPHLGPGRCATDLSIPIIAE